MKVKSVFQTALPYIRRTERRGERRCHNDFQPLSSSENTEYSTNTRERETDSSRSVRNVHETLIPESGQQLSIELTNLQGALRRNNDLSTSSSQNTSSNCGNFTENYCESDNLFIANSNLRFDDDFQVYNSTSEELPPDEFGDRLPRWNVSELISEGSIVENILPREYTRRRGKCDSTSCCCWWPCCRIHIRKSHIKSILISLLMLVCVTSFIILVLSLRKTAEKKEMDDFAALLNEDWPLHDIEAKIEDSQEWNLNLDYEIEKKKVTEANKRLSNGLQSIVRTTSKIPGMLTINDHFVDQTIAEEVFHSARDLLKSKLNENSSMLEIISWKGEATNFVIQELQRRTGTSGKENNLQGELYNDICYNDDYLVCNETFGFRTTNGSCNNVFHKSWGSLFSHFYRLNNPISMNEPLPLTDSKIEILTGGTPRKDPDASAILPVWAMFILHDTLKTAESPVSCYEYNDNSQSNIIDHKALESKRETCMFSSHLNTNSHDKTQCLLSSPCPAIYPACKIAPRTSFNLVTSFIDASNIYGSSEERMNKLRLRKFGKMKVKLVNHKHGKGFLPFAHEQKEACFDENNKNCFISGDDDVHQLSALTALNTLFVRQHNWIASWLFKMNTHWDDERLFQESRRIVIAQIQHITYNEFLPQILGNQMMNLSRLVLQRNGFYQGYNSKVDPSVTDAFAGAVGFFWYSMAVEKVRSIWKMGKDVVQVKYDINAQILRPEFLLSKKGHLDAIIRGFASEPVNLIGLEFTPLLRSLKIKSLNTTVNLVRTVLERARRLQIATYIEWRQTCGFRTIKSFEDIKDNWYPEAYSSIKSVYRTLEQVDLFTGMLAETPIPSGRVGPTLTCLLIDQFLRFKQGDRFWYEGNVYFKHFTGLQLNSIRETTLARILCDNTDSDFDEIQKLPLILTSPQTNPLLSCTDIKLLPRVNFHLWKENLENPSHDYDMSTENNNYDDDVLSLESEENSENSVTEYTVKSGNAENSSVEIIITVPDGKTVNATNSNNSDNNLTSNDIFNTTGKHMAEVFRENFTSESLSQINSTREHLYNHPLLQRMQQTKGKSVTNNHI